MKYNPKIVNAFYREFNIPEPLYEHAFHPHRKWRFDLAWPDERVAIEVQGGLFVHGRHTRGAALIAEHEKLNHAAMLGWRVLFVQPDDLCLTSTAQMIRICMEWSRANA